MQPPSVAPALAREMRRLEGQHLALLRQHLLHLRKGRARPGAQHQFAGLVVDDSRIGQQVEHGIVVHRQPVETFGATAADVQRLAAHMGHQHAGAKIG